jgi:cystathionine beta-lyase/cystathionine gamma-synthase
MNRIADIAAITQLAENCGALTVLDNTFAGVHQHGSYKVDIYTHSLTKYASGHGDVMGGAVIARQELIDRLRPDFTLLGGTLDAHAAYLIQRGLKTYFLRYRAQSSAAGEIVAMLASHTAVARVHYPGQGVDAESTLAKTQMQDFGAVISFDLRGGAESARRFTESLQLFSLAASLGATDSLVMPPQLLGHHDLVGERRAEAGIGAGTVRLSIGLEDVADLKADIARALAAIV